MSIPTSSPVRISIRTKLLIYILLTAIIIFATTFGYIISNTNKNAIEDAQKFVNSTAQEHANSVKATLDNDIAICRSMVSAFSGYKNISSDDRMVIYNHILKDILISNPQFVSTWTSWEIKALNPDFREENGRERYTYYREGDNIIYQQEILEVGEQNLSGIYYDLKKNPKESLTDAYFYSYTNEKENEILESSIAIPIMDNGTFVGLTGADIELERFHAVIGEIVPFEGSYAIMISGSGQIVSHPDRSLIDTQISDTEISKHASFNLVNKMKSGEPFSYTENTENQGGLFISFAPFKPGISNETWYIGIVVPSDIILLKAEETFKISILVGFLGIILLAGLIWFIASSITSPLKKTTTILNQLSTGDVKDLEVFEVNTNDELSEMAKALQTLSNSLKKSADFARSIGKGNLDQNYNPLSNNDILGNSLIQMRHSLLELRNVNDKNRWMQTSLVRISELLQGEKTIAELGNLILTALAEILDIQIASIFFNNNGELTLSSSYSYNIRKSNLNKFKFGEGLVGQSAVEQKLLVFTEVPDDYISIKSGLGEITPKVIVVAPLVYQKKVIAVMELGSAKELTMSKLDFITQISENLALGFNSINTRIEMEALLGKTQTQAEELRVQQEELVSSNKELEAQTNALRVSEEELQQQQEELKVTNEELEEKTKFLEQQRVDITNKNLELENIGKNLEQKAEELEIASKYKSEFLANMSHELRTPLNSLLILSGSLSENKEENLTEEQVESAEIIYKSGNDLLTMINDILDLSKIESGKMDINISRISLKDISENIRDYFKHGITQKNIEFKIQLDENLSDDIQSDQQKIEQILKNFMSNALKFTNKGRITLRFHLPKEQNAENADKVCVSVIDTGIGIPEDKQQAIFEAFQQADGSISRKFGGTGLGLSISRELAKLLGGKINIKSKTGEGSTFTFCMPTNVKSNPQVKSVVKKSTPDKTKSETENKEIAVPPPTNFSDQAALDFIKDDYGKIKKDDQVILVIEDDPTFARILYKQCHERGFKCVASPTGEYGFELANKLIPHAIILDIKLPGIDGWRVLDLLKTNPGTRHIPVHIMSGGEETITASTKGAIGYLTKPIKLNVLDKAFSRIESFINKKTGNLLLIEDDDNLRKSIKILIGDEDVKITDAATGKEAIELLEENNYDCMILDLGLSDMSGFELIEKLNSTNTHRPPIIVYTGRDLTKKENETLEKYAESIIIKGVKSEERLLDETALFMHRVIADMPKKQQAVIKKMHSKEDVFKDKRVLIVDDDMRNIFALTKILSEQNMIVSRAENGIVALDLINKSPKFDIMLMDIMMPEMDGYEAMREIRKIREQKNVPIIALTAKAMKDDRQKCIEAGANDYMAKPIVIEKLLSLLRVWLYK
jgi:CheY-like chemotaxis protein/signal transduction histidine kinase/HAMP domain-containing protein